MTPSTTLVNKRKPQTPKINQKQIIINKPDRRIRHRIMPQLRESFCQLVSGIASSLPEDSSIVESIIIKNDKVLVTYKRPCSDQKQSGSLENKPFITTSELCVVNLGDARVIERLDAVYQVDEQFRLS
jgi:hypothetical protein